MFSVVPSSNPLPWLASYQLGFLALLCFIWIIGSLSLKRSKRGEDNQLCLCLTIIIIIITIIIIIIIIIIIFF